MSDAMQISSAFNPRLYQVTMRRTVTPLPTMWGHPPCSRGVCVISLPMSIDIGTLINFIILTMLIIDENPIEAHWL